MKLFVPPLGTNLRLTAPWTFNLQHEYRNDNFWDALDLPLIKTWEDRNKIESVTFEAETILRVDRIFIRKGSKDFDSVTFTVAYSPNKRICPKKTKGEYSGTPRFWVKLADANNIECVVHV